MRKNQIRETIIFLTLLVFMLNFVYASDLSNYPNLFVEDGSLNALIVVGDKASSSDAITQSNLVLFYGNYLGYPARGSTKLASEITTLNQNLISIGNPCNNEITSQIMNYPQPCNKNFEKGKAYILLFNYGQYFHLVAAGFSNEGTKKAVDALRDFKKFNLVGNNFVIDVEEANTSEKENQEITNIKKEIDSDNLSQSISNVSKEEENTEKPQINKKSEERINENENKPSIAENKQAEKNEENFFRKIIRWILSIFR